MPSSLGSFTFVLHSHLPYVLNHGQWPHGMDWIHEAALGCYLPLLKVFRSLAAAGKNPQVTLGITPVLAEQLADPDFAREFRVYLKNRRLFAEQNRQEFSDQGQPAMADLAGFWLEQYADLSAFYNDEIGRDIIGAFRELQDQGNLEIITCGATHGYFPLLSQDASIRFQVAQGIETYEQHFGRKPLGIWLPECAYRPAYEWTPPVGKGKASLRAGVEEILYQYGIQYFITDSHLLKGGEAIGTYLDRFDALRRLWAQYEAGAKIRPEDEERTTLESYWVASRPDQEEVAAIFTRDPDTALTVWSADVGFPGDGWYLDFHKKHFPGGLKFWRVTRTKSDLAEKEPYQPEKVEGRLNENADHFCSLVKSRLAEHQEKTGLRGHITAPFDTELFGHWWFEGPRFLEKVLTRLADDPQVDLMSCGNRMAQVPPRNVVSLPEGSWGQGGFHWIWLNQDTEWTWHYVYDCEAAFAELRDLPRDDGSELGQVVEQAARELLLLQASDWQFLISTWSARDYAEMRFSEHVSAFRRLVYMAKKLAENQELDQGERGFLKTIQARDHIFSNLRIADFK
ncbi:MAG: DUF1957 domain-containing protein [Desulfarculaceae bacterium]|jgi:1,4-alpha-glucan branching enzyme